MTVTELIARLQQMDGDRVVVLAIDPEGNGFGLLETVDETSYSDGEIGPGMDYVFSESELKAGWSEYDKRDGTPAVVLWP